ncbi:MAG: DUF3824 domain-containing protein [Propionibacteriaceae bacterium]|nr:DUF3824 domain-containing protein [Propionibacteriaceae bacterium]
MSEPTQPLQTPSVTPPVPAPPYAAQWQTPPAAAPFQPTAPAPPYNPAQWQTPPGWGGKPAPTKVGALVGGGLITLAGFLTLAGNVMNFGSAFFRAFFSFGPSIGWVLHDFGGWGSVFGTLILGIVALVAARRHLAAVAVAAVVILVIQTAYSTWQLSSIMTLPWRFLQIMWPTLTLLLAICLLLALALSTRATTAKVLKIVAIVLLAVVLIITIRGDVIGSTYRPAWLLVQSFSYPLTIVGLLVLVASVKTPSAPARL